MALLASRDRGLLDTILNLTPHGIIVFDAQGRQILLHRAAERIWAAPHGGLAPISDGPAAPRGDGASASAPPLVYRAFHPDGRPYEPHDYAYARCLASGDVVGPEEIEIQRLDGSRGTLVGSCAPVRGKEGELEGAVAIFADISALKEVERRLAAREHELADFAQAAAQRADRLLRLTLELGTSLTAKQVARVVVTHGIAAFDADGGSLGIVADDGVSIDVLATAGVPQIVVDAYRRFQLDAELPMAQAIRDQEPIFIESRRALAERWPALASAVGDTSAAATASVPLVVDGRALGAVGLRFSRERSFSDHDRATLAMLASQCAQAMERARLYDAERRARHRAEVNQSETEALFRLTQAINRADSTDQVYEPALDAVTGILGVSRASILLFDSEGVMRVRAARGLSQAYCDAVEGHSPWRADEQEAAPLLVPDVRDEPSLSGYRTLFEREKIRSVGFIPLSHRRRLLGKFMIYSEEPRALSARELQLAQTIAAQIAQAVARAQLFEDERRARAVAERRAERTRVLQTITDQLSRALLPAQVAAVVVDEGASTLGARSIAIWLLDDAHAQLVMLRSFGYPEGTQLQRLALDPATPAADAVLRGEPVWLESLGDYGRRYPASLKRVRALEAPRPTAVACLPLRIEDRTFGVLVVTFGSERRFDDEERSFLLLLSRHCAQALERARLFAAERTARAETEAAHERTSFLLQASILLSSSLEFQVTLNKVAQLAVSRMADWCAVEIADRGPESVRSLAVAHIDPAKVELAAELRRRYPPDPAAPSGVAEVLRTGRTELYAEIPDELLVAGARDAEHLRISRALGLRSAMVVPMVARDRIFGAITFVYAESGRRYSQADLEIAELLGRRAGIAIDNARLYEQARDAVRLRDDFLSVAGHELKTPLTALLLQIESIGKLMEEGAPIEKLRERLGKAMRNMERLSKLTDELLDVSRVTAGQLRLEPEHVDLGDLVQEVASRAAETLAQAGCELRLTVTGRGFGRWDRMRIEQVATNLIANAAKYGKGQPIDVAVELGGVDARLAVRDRGIGIAPEDHGRIFDRFERAVSSQHFGGLGLGLWIVKQIVEAHGGAIRVTSAPGEGAEFHVTLPLAGPGGTT